MYKSMHCWKLHVARFIYSSLASLGTPTWAFKSGVCAYVIRICLIDFLGHCKGGNFNILTGRGSTFSSAQEGKSGSIYLIKSF